MPEFSVVAVEGNSMFGHGLRSVRAFVATPVLGVAAGFVFVLGAIVLSTHSLLAFFSIEGLVVVVGGVIAVAFMSFEAADVRCALAVIGALLRETDGPEAARRDALHRDMTEIIGWAYMVKEHGMRRLEASLARHGFDDPFVKYGLNMVVSEYPPEDVRAMMETAADAGYERESVPVEVLQTMASHAPAFGMIGTLVGMVAMLCNLHDDVSSIGSSLSVSFLSTLYGVLSARMIYMPAAARLRQIVEKRRFRNQLITEGMVLLLGDKSPGFVKDRLNSFLRPENHDYLDQFADETPSKVRPMHLRVIGA
jgi:chemotaxis protein MotA